jgi:hypothetical protein
MERRFSWPDQIGLLLLRQRESEEAVVVIDHLAIRREAPVVIEAALREYLRSL